MKQTTLADFQLFIKICKEDIKLLGFQDWHIEFLHQDGEGVVQ